MSDNHFAGIYGRDLSMILMIYKTEFYPAFIMIMQRVLCGHSKYVNKSFDIFIFEVINI